MLRAKLYWELTALTSRVSCFLGMLRLGMERFDSLCLIKRSPEDASGLAAACRQRWRGGVLSDWPN